MTSKSSLFLGLMWIDVNLIKTMNEECIGALWCMMMYKMTMERNNKKKKGGKINGNPGGNMRLYLNYFRERSFCAKKYDDEETTWRWWLHYWLQRTETYRKTYTSSSCKVYYSQSVGFDMMKSELCQFTLFLVKKKIKCIHLYFYLGNFIERYGYIFW